MTCLRKIRASITKWASRLSYAFGLLTIVLPARALAATAGGVLPWDAPLTTLQNDLQGTVAHAIVTAAIIGTGITWSVSEHGTGVRKMSAVAFGGAAALGATQLMTTLFPLGAASSSSLGESSMNEGTRRLNVIHQSLVRPVLLAGAERPLAIANWIASAALILGGGQWYTAVLGALLATGGHWALVEAAKVDPQFSRVYIRHYRYQERYPARACVWAPPRERIRPTVPTPREMRG